VLTEEAAGPLLAQWQNFYVIAGSSAGALSGLQFVVMALMNETDHVAGMPEVRAFGTPTVVHFCAALLISGIASAPWATVSGAALALGICGAAGVVYALAVIRRAIQQTGYHPDPEDWFWFAALPLVTYAALLAAAVLLAQNRTWSLFIVAGTTLLLLFDGIHNAWDTVAYVAVGHSQKLREARKQKETERK
jgi:hypothetical protein